MTKEIVEASELQEQMSIAKVFAESGMFPDVKGQAQAVVKIMAGKELNLSPFQSMKSLYFVSGKLGIMADVMASRVKTSDKYDYIVDILTNEECKITFFQTVDGKKEKLGVSEFSLKDAAKAGLVNRDNWKNYPRNQLFARCISNGTRWFCPDVICGYNTVEELDGMYEINNKETITITADGEVKNEGVVETD